ncbi:hypothetical protein Droror1_Dr00005796 [Drosera rotundifolia]
MDGGPAHSSPALTGQWGSMVEVVSRLVWLWWSQSLGMGRVISSSTVGRYIQCFGDGPQDDPVCSLQHDQVCFLIFKAEWADDLFLDGGPWFLEEMGLRRL